VILYLDTSALVKLYVPETDSATVKQLVDAADMSSTSRIAYAEARAAFARKRRERAVTLRDYRTIVQDFDNDWESFFIVDVSDALIKRAGQVAETFALRGYDAVHLASAVIVGEQGSQSVRFACFDEKLSRAARRQGLAVLS
jgi:predicted nucleic acid-binding protein